MATIGSIAVAFEADLKGLESGVRGVLGLFDDISSAVDDLSKKLDGISSKSIKIDVDSSSLAEATKEIESLSKAADESRPVIKPSADTSEIKKATEDVEDLSESIEATTPATATARAAVAQLVVTTARYASVVAAGATAYRNLRESTLGYIQSATGAESATEGLSVIQSALRGNTESIRIVLAAVSRSVGEYARSLFSVEGAANAMNAAVRLTARAIGISDSAVVDSISYLSSFVTHHTAVAATNTLTGRTLGVVGAAYNRAGAAVEEFLARSSAGTRIGSALASAIDSISPVVSRLNNYFNQASIAATRLFQRLSASESVSRAIGVAFDAIYRSVRDVAAGSSSVVAAFGRLIPSAGAVSAAMTRAASLGGAAVSVLGRLATALGVVAGAYSIASDKNNDANEAASGFAGLMARSAAASAAFGAASGALSAYAAGTSALAGAVTGAVAGVTSFVAALPLVAPVAIAAAVATGKFHHALEELSLQAQQVDQMADRFGAPRQEIEKLRLAAQNTGVGLGQLAKGQQNFYTSLSKIKVGQMNVENVREAKLAFDALDISMSSLKNARPDEVFKMVAERLSEIKDPAKRTQVAFDLFGKQGAMILPALKEYGELSADFDRLGGSIAQIDFERLLSLENSFDRQKAAAASLGKVLLLPFVELQKAFNNISADISGGLASALGPVMSMLADMTKPFAVIIEFAGRMINIFLRIAGVVTTLFAGFSKAIGIADIFTGIQQGVNAALAPIEKFIGLLQKAANFITQRIGFAQAIFIGIGKAIGFVVGGLAQLVTYVALGAVAWGVYSAAVAVATGLSLAATYQFIAMWIAALGPFALIIGGLAVIGAGIALITYGVVKAAEWFYTLGESVGLFGEDAEKIDASTASTEELANAARRAAVARAAMGGIKQAIFGAEEVSSAEEITDAISTARDGIGDLIIKSAKFGDAGSEAASAAQKSFNELQQSFADGNITLEKFQEESEKVRGKLEENLAILENDSPEVTLKKNLELYKSLGDAAKQAGKEMRDAMADVKIGDKFFPRSEEVKAKAQEFQDKYAAALEAIKKKQQAGGFGRELQAKKDKNEADRAAGRVTTEQYEAIKLRLDSTSAQEEAQKAAEDAKRTLENDMGSLDLSFADDIRKRLQDAFKSPVEQFQRELEKVRKNMDLSDEEKAQAEKMLRKEAREGIIGKTAGEKFTERNRDIGQARAEGLINDNEAMIEAAKAADELAKSLGIPVDPANALKIATLQLEEELGKGTISAKQFASGMDAARRNFLESLGIKEKPGEADKRRLDELQKQRDAGKITDEEFNRGRQAIENDVVGQSASDRIREQRARIDAGVASGAVSAARGDVAQRKLDVDRKQAAGLEASPAEQLMAGVDKINDAFGTVGMTMDEIQATLSPQEFADYQEAIKKNSDAVKASLGIEKSDADKLSESRRRLDKALAEGVITAEERDKAVRKQRDDILASLGIDKSPAQEAKERMEKLSDAFRRGEISADELAKGVQKTKDSLLQSLGIPLDPVAQLRQRLNDLNDAFNKGQITQEEFARGQEEARRSMIPGGEAESPVKKFQRDMEAVNRAVEEGLITDEEGSARKKNLQAQLQEDLKPSLDRLKPDRRSIDSSDSRSKGGVDTFFRILRGRDNPGLKAQLDTARHTRLIAEAMQEPDAAPVIHQLQAR